MEWHENTTKKHEEGGRGMFLRWAKTGRQTPAFVPYVSFVVILVG
jgi:hypothetical protein